MADEEIERLAASYAGSNFRERLRIRVEPVCERSGEQWTLDEFIALIEQVKVDMPPDVTDAQVEFDGGGYDGSGKFTVSYVTWEPEAEQWDRIARSLAYAVNSVNAERRAYEHLKAKFEKNQG